MKTMFTRVKMSAEKEIHRSVYASVVRSRTEKGNKRKNVYDARRSIEEAINKISGEYYFCIQHMLIILALGRLYTWHELHVQMALKCLVAI